MRQSNERGFWTLILSSHLARRSSNILIKVDSDASDEDKAAAKAKAQECLNKINSGELSFEDAWNVAGTSSQNEP